MSQQERIYKYSPSGINQFLFCSQSYDFGHQKNLPVVPTEAVAIHLGKAVHEAISDYYSKIAERPTPMNIEAIAKGSFETFVVSEFKSHRVKVANLLRNFVMIEQARLKLFRKFRPTLVEHKLTNDLLVGVIDAYWQEEGICFDWKTGAAYDTISEDYVRQGSCYRQLLNDAGLPCQKVMFGMLDNGRVYEIPQMTKEWLVGQIDRVRYGKVYPNRGRHCEQCGYNIRCEMQEVGGLWQI